MSFSFIQERCAHVPPRRLSGYLWKLSPTKLRGYQLRFVIVEDAKICWWHSAEDFRLRGPQSCKGFLDFFENLCEVTEDSSDQARFSIIPGMDVGGDSFLSNGNGRPLTLDITTYSEYHRREWIAVIKEHIQYARSRPQRNWTTDSKIGELQQYWDKHELTETLGEAVEKLNAVRPEFPLQFLVSYLGMKGVQQDPRPTTNIPPESKHLKQASGLSLRQMSNQDDEQGNFKILIIDVNKACLPHLARCGTVDTCAKITEGDLHTRIGNYDALVCRSSTKITSNIIDAATRLKIIALSQVNTDNVPVGFCAKRGIRICNSPKGSTISIAEHTIAIMLCMMRKLNAADQCMRTGRWARAPFIGHQMYGSTLGLLGFGSIAVHIAKLAIAFGMKVLAYDPYAHDELAQTIGVTLFVHEEDLPKMFKSVHVLCVHAPLTPKTTGMIGRKQISMMKHGSFIVSSAKGGVVNEEDVAEALLTGHLGGAALDVFDAENNFIVCGTVPADWGLRSAPNTVLTPHISPLTKQALEAVAEDAAKQVADFLMKGLETRYPITHPENGDPAKIVDARPMWMRNEWH